MSLFVWHKEGGLGLGLVRVRFGPDEDPQIGGRREEFNVSVYGD
jgi:hypothetical protein